MNRLLHKCLIQQLHPFLAIVHGSDMHLEIKTNQSPWLAPRPIGCCSERRTTTVGSRIDDNHCQAAGRNCPLVNSWVGEVLNFHWGVVGVGMMLWLKEQQLCQFDHWSEAFREEAVSKVTQSLTEQVWRIWGTAWGAEPTVLKIFVKTWDTLKWWHSEGAIESFNLWFLLTQDGYNYMTLPYNSYNVYLSSRDLSAVLVGRCPGACSGTVTSERKQKQRGGLGAGKLHTSSCWASACFRKLVESISITFPWSKVDMDFFCWGFGGIFPSNLQI